MSSTEGTRRLSPITETSTPQHMPHTPAVQEPKSADASASLLFPNVPIHPPTHKLSPSTNTGNANLSTKIPSPSPHLKTSPRANHIHHIRTQVHPHPRRNAYPKLIPARPAPPPPPPHPPSPSFTGMISSPSSICSLPGQAQNSRGRRAVPETISTRLGPSPNGGQVETENVTPAQPCPKTSLLYSPPQPLRSPTLKEPHVALHHDVDNIQSSTDESTPTMAPVGTLGTEHNSHADEGNKKPMEQPSPERRQRPLAAVAPYRTKPGIKNNTRSLSSGRAHHVHQRPASALGHPSFTPLAEALPLTRGNSLILLSSKDAQRNNTDDSPSPRRVRLQNGGSPRLSPPPSPSPRGQPGRVLVPVPDDFNLDGMEDSRFDLPRRRRSARFASLISRFGQDAARRLTKSPTPSPLSTLVRPDRDEPPRPTIRPANRQSGAFGVTDDGSDAESTHRFYHDNTRRRRNSCGSIVEEAVRSLYAENADIHSHSEEEDEMPPKDKRKTSGALGLLYLMPHDSAQQSNSASDLSCAGLDTSSSSPPGLSRSSSQWTPTNDSLATPTSASPCSTLCVSPDTAESLLLAASHLLNTHGVTLLHHAEQLSESSTRLRALATESLEWGSRLMAAANRSREAIQPPQMITAENLSQSPTPVPRSSTDGQQRAFPKPAPLPARRKDEHRLSQRATKRKSWILKPIRHSRLLVEAERLAALDWNGSQAGERAHCTEPGDTSATSSDEYVLISGSCLSTSPEPISRVPSPSMSDAQHDMPTAFSSSVDPLRDESINSHESAISDGDIDALPSLLPPIDLTPPTPRAVPSVTTREPPVSESLLNDDSTGVLFGLPSGSPEPEYPDNPSTPTLSTMSLNPEDRSSERNRSTLSLQMDFGVVHAPFATMMNPGPAVPDRGFYLDPQFAQTSITQPSARVTPMPQVLPRKSETDLSSRIRRRLSSRRRVREPERAGSTTPRRWFGRLGRQTEQLH